MTLVWQKVFCCNIQETQQHHSWAWMGARGVHSTPSPGTQNWDPPLPFMKNCSLLTKIWADFTTFGIILTHLYLIWIFRGQRAIWGETPMLTYEQHINGWRFSLCKIRYCHNLYLIFDTFIAWCRIKKVEGK